MIEHATATTTPPAVMDEVLARHYEAEDTR